MCKDYTTTRALGTIKTLSDWLRDTNPRRLSHTKKKNKLKRQKNNKRKKNIKQHNHKSVHCQEKAKYIICEEEKKLKTKIIIMTNISIWTNTNTNV